MKVLTTDRQFNEVTASFEGVHTHCAHGIDSDYVYLLNKWFNLHMHKVASIGKNTTAAQTYTDWCTQSLQVKKNPSFS